MSFQRVGLRLSQRLRSPVTRSALQRRFESTKLPSPGMKLEGAADNAFNRERAAVKAHAQATTGEWFFRSSEELSPEAWLTSADLWRRLSI